MCDEWKNNFKSFYDWSMSHGYSETLTIERINNELGYYPENCKWATIYEQNQNKRNVTLLTYDGETKSLSAWGKSLGLGKDTVRQRYRKNWSVEECLFGRKKVIKP